MKPKGARPRGTRVRDQDAIAQEKRVGWIEVSTW